MFEEKEVLIKRLVEKRKQQIRAGLETEEQEDVRREEMRSEYADHIAQYVDYIKEYWVKAPMDPMNPLTVPGTEKIDDDISYTHCHEWDEAEFMLLIFKIEVGHRGDSNVAGEVAGYGDHRRVLAGAIRATASVEEGDSLSAPVHLADMAGEARRRLMRSI